MELLQKLALLLVPSVTGCWYKALLWSLHRDLIFSWYQAKWVADTRPCRGTFAETCPVAGTRRNRLLVTGLAVGLVQILVLDLVPRVMASWSQASLLSMYTVQVLVLLRLPSMIGFWCQALQSNLYRDLYFSWFKVYWLAGTKHCC